MRIFIFLTAIAVSSLTLVGCKKSAPTEPSSTNPTTQIVTEQHRTAVFNQVAHMIDSLPWTDIDSSNKVIAAYLRSSPDIRAVGIDDSASNVWAIFNDNRMYIIANNRPLTDTAAIFPKMEYRSPLDNGPAELPSSKKALVINAMGTLFVDPTRYLSQLLSSRGYDVVTSKGSVEDLLTKVAGDGILYIDTHGGVGRNPADDAIRRFGLWTSTPRTPEADVQYAELLESNQLCYFSARTDHSPGGIFSRDTGTIETHYAITKDFVMKHFSFTQDEIVYLDACTSVEIQPAFLNASEVISRPNPVTVISWSASTGDGEAYKAAKFLFDRLLGTNYSEGFFQNPPREDPPQRPFSIDAVFKDMHVRGIDTYSAPVPRQAAPHIAVLSFTRSASSKFGLLAPTIKNMSVIEESDTLIINGSFGMQPGIVKINGNEVSSRWGDEQIKCQIPKSGNTAAGNVFVEVNGHRSNIVPLTEWNGHVKITMNSFGSLHELWDLNLHLRADVHSFRLVPHRPAPKPEPKIITTCVQDSKGSIAIGGTGSYSASDPVTGCTSTETESWTSSGDTTLKAVTKITFQGNEFSVDVVIYPADKSMELNIRAIAPRVVSYSGKQTLTCPDVPPGDITFHNSGVGVSYGPVILKLKFDDKFNIVEDQKDSSLQGSFYAPLAPLTNAPKFPFPSSWDGMEAHYPPADTSAQEIQPIAVPAGGMAEIWKKSNQ